MRLTVLGAGTLVPHASRGPASFAVDGGGNDLLLFDLGAGALHKSAAAGLDWRKTSHVFFTHYHPDHTLDLVSLLFAANHAPPEPRTAPLNVLGPAGLEGFLQNVYAAWPAVMPKRYELIARELNPGTAVRGAGGLTVTCGAVSHGDADALGYRVEGGGRVLALTGDTQYCPEAVRLARNADLLVAECSADEEHAVEGHMSPSQVARLAAEAGVGRVVITHVYPPLAPPVLAAEIAGETGIEVVAAEDLLTVDV